MTEPSENISTMPSTTALIRGIALAALLVVGGYYARYNYMAVIQVVLDAGRACWDAYNAGLAGVVGLIKGLFPYQSLSASIVTLFYITLFVLLARIAYVTRRALKTGPLKDAEQRAADTVLSSGLAFVASIVVFSLLEAMTVDYPPHDDMPPMVATFVGVTMTLVFGLFLQAICYVGFMSVLRDKAGVNWLTDFRMYVLGALWVPSIPGISPLNVGLFAALVVLSATLEPLGDISRWLEAESADQATKE